VPTIAEAADLPNFEVVLWIGLFAPAGTSKDIVERLNTSVVRSLEVPELRERLQASGILPLSSTPQALGERVRRDIGAVSEMAKSGRLKAN
jgi:tripartite-type tricarboxylate transporter receptor subunit TctC